MFLRFLVLLFVATGMFGQTGIFGPVSVHLRAGDLAPDLVFSRVLNAQSDAPWSQANLVGRTTVIAFFPDTSHNPQSVSRWNALIEQFADKPVQFVWITAENETSLLPWLQAHRMKGWVFYDPEGATGRAYGMGLPAGVIIGNDGRIVGFERMMLPSAQTLNAALEGRITTIPPKPGNAAFKALVENTLVLLDAEPPRMPGEHDHRPGFAPSYTVHITPAKSDEGGNFSGGDYWSLQNFELKEALAELYEINSIRIHLPPALDDGKRYNFAIVLPQAESKESMRNRLQQAIEDQFRVSLIQQQRFEDVYVVTALSGKRPEAKVRQNDDLFFSRSSTSSVELRVSSVAGRSKAAGIDDIRSISVEGTMDEFCHTLESELDRPVVNETDLKGDFVFHVEAGTGVKSDFLDRLRERMNLEITPAQRRVEILVVAPR
jgi:uncharacterized protein (TIGR03435 family)